MTAAAVLLSLVAGIVGTTWQSLRATEAGRNAIASAVVAKSEAARAEDALSRLEVRRREAEQARQEALLRQQEAIAQRDKTQQLMDFQSAEYALRDGDLQEAMQRLTAAERLSSNWEYGNFFGQIVNKAREHFAPVRRWPVREGPQSGLLVVPKSTDELERGVAWAVFAYADELRCYDTANGTLLGSHPIAGSKNGDGSIPPGLVTIESVAAKSSTARPLVAHIDGSGRLHVHRLPSLEVMATRPETYRFGVLAAADDSTSLATVDSDGVVTVVDAMSGEIIARKSPDRIDQVRRMAISPDGEIVIFASTSTEFAPQLWSWREDQLIDVPTRLQWFAFADEATIVGQHSYSTLGEKSQ